MSTWNLGANDVSEETHAFRNKIASKDAHIAAQQDKLARQAAEIEELRRSLTETLHKLSAETSRALNLENDLHHCTEDLRNEKLATQNAQQAVMAAQSRAKENNLEMRDLESTLERISATSDEHKAHAAKLEREKSILESRVKELEVNLREATAAISAPGPTRKLASRHRSSSLSNFRITTLEQDLSEFRGLSAKKEAEIQSISQKLSQVQQDLIKCDNEKVANERRLNSRLEELEAAVEEKEEELLYLRDQGNNGSREDELLQRIEEDEAKIAALEAMLRNDDSRDVRDRLRKVESQAREDQRRLRQAEDRCIDLVRQKEEALDELEDAKQEVERLCKHIEGLEARNHVINERARKSLKGYDDPLMSDDTCLIDIHALEPQQMAVQPTSTDLPEQDEDTVAHIERLLLAIDRLRAERDSLRRDVHFLQSESRFTIEALEAKLCVSMSTVSEQTTATIHQLKAEMDELYAQLEGSKAEAQSSMSAKNAELARLSRLVQGLSLSISRLEQISEASECRARHAEGAHEELVGRLDINSKLLEQARHERGELEHQIWNKDLDEVALLGHDKQQEFEDLLHQVSDLSGQLEDVESERDSLTLQVTNLHADLHMAQEELANAESRYASLQFHQLSNMSSSEATRTLKEHIGELEQRIMRRTEQIGIHQHDIRRMETNLKLQEERLSEMAMELEMMAAQKDAMVEDCADARETRDEALARVEVLEDELENVESREADNEKIILSLVATIAETVCNARSSLRSAADQNTALQSSRDQMGSKLRTSEQQLQDVLAQINLQREEVQRTTLALAVSQVGVKKATRLAHTFEHEKQLLTSQMATIQNQHYESTISDLRQDNAHLQDRLRDREAAGATTEEAERNLVQLRLQHAETIGSLQSRLVEVNSTLEETQTRLASAKEEHGRTMTDARESTVALERRLEDAQKDLVQLKSLRDKLNALEHDSDSQLVQLREELSRLSDDHDQLQRAYDSLLEDKERLVEDMSNMEQEHAALLTRSLDEHYAAQRESEKKISNLQKSMTEQTRLAELSKEEASRLSARLSGEVEERTKAEDRHREELDSVNDQINDLEKELSDAREEKTSFQDRLETVESQFRAIEEEKDTLQREATTFEAEIQKAKSLSRYLEIQLSESQQAVTSLKAELERARVDHVRVDQACKTAELNLSLSKAEHKRQIGELQRELTAYHSRPNLEKALADLEERNNEMEELLRAKCSEIEENDDRALEMMKEKKKLATKVESLTRKVQNLQAKLAAAKATSGAPLSPDSAPSNPTASIPSVAISAPAPSPNVQPPTEAFSRVRSTTVSSMPSMPSVPSAMPASVRGQASSRTVSGPSSLPRPKTPERTKAITPVFKAKTPERRVLADVDPDDVPVVIGKKRAAPDDFATYNSMPAQPFTPDGQDVENRTPRMRKVLHSLQSGFTPNRNHSRQANTSSPQRSPRRTAPSATSAFISDMTNSPHLTLPNPSSTKPSSKRSWLGKIRGNGSSQLDSRSIFDRGGPS